METGNPVYTATADHRYKVFLQIDPSSSAMDSAVMVSLETRWMMSGASRNRQARVVPRRGYNPPSLR
ncbi:hypothetical protein ABIC22_000694 [Paenibacillus sp. PvP094]